MFWPTFTGLTRSPSSSRLLPRLNGKPDGPMPYIIVDNGSTDGTLDRAFPEWATIIRNPENVGVSGSIRNGITYAFENGFDWIWILDADSTADPEALATLLDLYAGWPSSLQEETAFIACLPAGSTGELSAPRLPLHAIWPRCCHSFAGPTPLRVPPHDLVWFHVPLGRRRTDRAPQP